MAINTRTFLSIMLCFGMTISYSQISFEKGYFINNTNQRISCYIKNSDWKNNPTEFVYKIALEGDKMTAKSLKLRSLV